MKFGCIYFCTQRFIQGKDESIHESDKEAVTLLRCSGACGSAAFLCPEKHRKYQLRLHGNDRGNDAHVFSCDV